MSRFIKVNALFFSLLLLLTASTAFAGTSLWPMQVGNWYEFNKHDSAIPQNNWNVRMEVLGTATIGNQDYFKLGEWNYAGDGAFSLFSMRSTDTASYFFDPVEGMAWQIAPVGTTWSYPETHDGGKAGQVIVEIVSIEQVTVPYGTFDNAYVCRKHWVADDNSYTSPYWSEYIVPGVGYVKEVDYWVDNAPTIQELAGTGAVNTQTLDQYMSQGVEVVKSMWQNKDITYIKIARDKFKAAYELQPNSQGANFHYAVTRIMALYCDPGLHQLLDRYGVTPGSFAPGGPRDPFNLTAEFQTDADGKVILPADSPTSQEMLDWIHNTMLPEVDGAIANLGKVDSSFNHILTVPETQASQNMEVDYGDIKLMKAGLEAFKGYILTVYAYNTNIDIDELKNKIDGDLITNINSFLTAYPDLLKPAANNSALLGQAKASFKAAIADYNDGSDFIRHETDPQDDDLITFDAESAPGEAKFRATLAEINESLNGGHNFCIKENSSGGCDEYLAVNLAAFFDNPMDLRAKFPTFTDSDTVIYGSFPDPTFNGIFSPSFNQEQIARFVPLPEYYVDVLTGSNGNSGGSMDYPLKNIGEALHRAQGTDIHVAAGTYNLDSGEIFPLDIYQDHLNLLGAGADKTIIDATGSNYGVINLGGVNATIDGFKITGGNGTDGYEGRGGGIHSSGDFPKISNCIISGNTVTFDDASGGGLYVSNGWPEIINCVIADNSLAGKGAGVHVDIGAAASFINCTIVNNTATDNGYQQEIGGGILVQGSTVTMTNCILGGNSPDQYYVGQGDMNYGYDAFLSIDYSDIQGGYDGDGNIDADPLFIGKGDYHLQAGSPCIDTATASGAPDKDIDGDIRPMGAGFDMGADEFLQLTTFYLDADSDGYGDPQVSTQAYSAPAGYVKNNMDCNDQDKDINPATVWYKDADDDGYTEGMTKRQCTRPTGYKLAGELTSVTSLDCDDSNTAVYPGTMFCASVAQLPIATNTDTATYFEREMGISAAFDGTNYLVGIQDAKIYSADRHDVTIAAQFVSQAGDLVGPLLSIGKGGGPLVAFDGTNYLMVWAEDATNSMYVYGQFISKTGELIGSQITVGTGSSIDFSVNSILFDGKNYFIVWEDQTTHDNGDSADVFGQFVMPTGDLLGSVIPICTAAHGQRMPTLAFDGANILVAWVDGRSQSACFTDLTGTHCYESDIYGQFITKSADGAAGSLSGDNFLIDASSLPRDNPFTVAFDGTNYFVVFSEKTTLTDCAAGDCDWNIYGQFVSQAGAAVGSKITISDTVSDNFLPFAAWNGAKYLVTWAESVGTPTGSIKGRYFSPAGDSIGAKFTLVPPGNYGRIPWAAITMAQDANYFMLVNQGKPAAVDPYDFDQYTNQDVYGAVITTSCAEKITFYRDADGDGFGDPQNSIQDCSAPQGYVTDNTDCDDSNKDIHPGVPEICDNLDNNCNGYVDEDLTRAATCGVGACGSTGTETCIAGNWANSTCIPGVPNTYYRDADGDGYGDPQNSIQDCSVPQGYVSDNTDCDDTNKDIHPGVPEICDNLDNNCNGYVDEDLTRATICGVGACGSTGTETCIAGNWANSTCIPGVPNTYYREADGDGYGDPQNSIQDCSAPQGYVSNNTDCDDTNKDIHPGATEVCDNIDNNCNGHIDEDLTRATSCGVGACGSTGIETCSAGNWGNSTCVPNIPTTFYRDRNHNGYGDSHTTVQDCSAPAGYVANDLDNDDDGDGLPDDWEYLHFNSLNQKPTDDPDGDGLNNLAEYQQGTNPNHKAVILHVDAENSQDTNQDGMLEHPFTNLAAAVNAAQADDLIKVSGGTYLLSADLHIPAGVKLGGRTWYDCVIDLNGQYQIQMEDYTALKGFNVINAAPARHMILLSDAGSVTIKNNVLEGNPAAVDGKAAIFVGNSSVLVENNTIVGGNIGVYTNAAGGSNIINNIITGCAGAGWKNTVAAPAAASGNAVNVDYNDFWNNGINYSGGNNISLDPLFVNPVEYNYHLRLTQSPCRNAGNPKDDYLDQDRSRNDMGADGGQLGNVDLNIPKVKIVSAEVTNLTVNFTATASDEWGIASWSWDFDRSNGLQTNSPAANNASYTYLTCGSYIVTLTVADYSGRVAVTRTTVDVGGVLDPIVINVSGVNDSSTVGDVLNFNATITGGQLPFTYSWNFGDGNTSSVEDPTHSFAAAGGYVVSLTVTDHFGCHVSYNHKFTVVGANSIIQKTQEISGNSDTAATINATVDGRNIVLNIPAAGLSEDTVVTVAEVSIIDTPLPSNISAIGLPVDFGPDGTVFSEPVTITIPYTDADLTNAGVSDPHELRVCYYDSASSSWVEVEVTGVDTTLKLIYAQTNHFTTYVLAAGAPTPPSNLMAAVVSESRIDLTWQDNSSDEDGFSIERKGLADVDFVEIAQVAANVTGYSNTGLTAGTQYWYRVLAFKSGQYSGYSIAASATTTNPSAGQGSGSGSSGGSGGCFIATAAFGSPMAGHVKLLRRFRDAFLLTNDLGRRFVAFYYAHSPVIADYIAQRDWLRLIVRIGLLPLIGLSWCLLNMLWWQNLLVLAGLGLAVKFSRRLVS